MKKLNTLDDISYDLTGKKILMRVDFNVPIANGKIADSSRIKSVLPTINELQKRGAKIILLSHFGRPKGKYVAELSFKNIYPLLKTFLSELEFCESAIGDEVIKKIDELPNEKILLLENVRFYEGEEKNEIAFAKTLAGLANYFVEDAFSVVHRVCASVVGVGNFLPSFAGRALQNELENLSKAIKHANKPNMAIIGGAKISSKLELLNNLIANLNCLVVGGAMANTFLAAKGMAIGNSLWEENLKATAGDILAKAKQKNCKIILPVDAIVANELKQGVETREIKIEETASSEIKDNELILDIGKNTIAEITNEISKAKSLIWNGPLGAFEIEPFANGTNEIAEKVGKATKAGKLSSIAGGGDTLAALGDRGKNFTFLSTGGGAFLEWLEGKNLKGIKILYT